MNTRVTKIGLALSGGGYRATAFHLGTLKKLHEMNLLSKLDVISTISGGSITGACYCTNTNDFQHFYDEMYNGLQNKNVIKQVLLSWMGFRFLVFGIIFVGSFCFLFTRYEWLFPVAVIVLVVLLLRFQFILFPVSKRIETIYDDFFYKKKKLGELPDRPVLVIGSTNLQTARPFSFSKHWMQDSTYQFMDDPIKFKAESFPISRAVMASSCVPFAFTPVVIAREFFVDETEADNFHPMLVDGGVYDNQGIHKVMQSGCYECRVVITSDACSGSSGELSFKNTFSLLMETVNVFMTRIKNSQMVRNVYDNAATVGKEVAYFSLGWDVEHCISGFITNLAKKQITASTIAANALKPEWVDHPIKYENEITEHLKHRLQYDAIAKPTPEEKKIARSVKTSLSSLSKSKIDCLIKQSEALTELQVKLYCPSLIQ